MYVAIDLGGTRCRVLIAQSPDKPEQHERHEFTLSHIFEQDMQTAIDLVQSLTKGNHLAGIGLSVPGDLDPEKTTLADPSDNLTEWSGKPVRAMFEQRFACPVAMENDGVTAGLGEAHFGLGKGKNFSFVIWGTGIGGAKVEIIDGSIVCNPLDWYQYLEDWESRCGGNAIRQLYGKEASQLSDTEWQGVMDDFQRQLAIFIRTTNARHIVFGGGIAIKQNARLLAVAQAFEDVSIQISQLGENAGLYGALSLLGPPS